MAKDEDDEVTKDLDAVKATAERLGLTGKDKQEYIHDHMSGFGYKARRSYFKPENENDNKGRSWSRGKSKSNDDDDEDF